MTGIKAAQFVTDQKLQSPVGSDFGPFTLIH
jgi:hypothetical protein